MPTTTLFQQYGLTNDPGSSNVKAVAPSESSESGTWWQGLENNSGPILNGVAGIIAATKGGNYSQYTNPAQPVAATQSPFPWLWVVIALVVVAVLYFMMKK